MYSMGPSTSAYPSLCCILFDQGVFTGGGLAIDTVFISCFDQTEWATWFANVLGAGGAGKARTRVEPGFSLGFAAITKKGAGNLQ